MFLQAGELFHLTPKVVGRSDCQTILNAPYGQLSTPIIQIRLVCKPYGFNFRKQNATKYNALPTELISLSNSTVTIIKRASYMMAGFSVPSALSISLYQLS